MDVKEEKASKYHCGPPWFFRGSALYQLHLVKADTARAFIPKELRLVEAFGYTLGGFFLAQYEDSPAGKFDELVVIAGIVWNPPTSCAWAARVLVNSDEACRHGRKEIGLPSHIATFSKKIGAVTEKSYNKSQSFLNRIAMNSAFGNPIEHSEVQVSESKNSSEISLCNISLPISVITAENSDKGMPKIKMSLPSFSGQTRDCPLLLKYSCEIECRISAVKPAKVYSTVVDYVPQKGFGKKAHVKIDILSDEEAQKRSILVLLSKPVLALKFSFLKMWVGAPKSVVLVPRRNEVKFSST